MTDMDTPTRMAEVWTAGSAGEDPSDGTHFPGGERKSDNAAGVLGELCTVLFLLL